MATTIVTKSGSGAPTASDLVAGELAVDLTNGRLYTEDSGGTVLELGLNPNGNVNVTGSITASGGISLPNTQTINWADSGGVPRQILQYYSDNNLYIDAPNGGHVFRNGAGNTQKVTIDLNGKVGIGTSSPASLLDVSSTGEAISTVRTTSTSGVRQATLRLNVPSTGGDDPAGRVQFTFGTGYTAAGSIEMTHTSPTMKFLTGTTERMRIDANGRVGIGTVSPSQNLSVHNPTGGNAYIDVTRDNATSTTLRLGAENGNTVVNSLGAVPLAFYTNGTEAMRIDSSGNVGIGAVPEAWATGVTGVDFGTYGALVDGTNVILARNAYYDGAWKYKTTDHASSYWQGGGGEHYWQTAASGSADAAITWSESMRLDASGNLLVGTTAAWYNRKVAFVGTGGTETLGVVTASAVAIPISVHSEATAGDNEFISFYTEASPTMRGYIDYNRTGNQVRYAVSSDQRLKENIAAAGDAGGTIDSIQVRQFDWKENGTHQEFGLVAQELLEVFPEGVSVKADPDKMMGVDYSKLVPMMLKEIQSLRGRVAALES